MNSPIVGKITISPGMFNVPKSILKPKETGIVIEWAKRYSGASWVTCIRAYPHVDLQYKDMYTVILGVKGNHMYGQEGYSSLQYLITPGTIFIVDPIKIHWLFPENDYESKSIAGRASMSRFIGLLWDIPKEELKTTLPKIMEENFKDKVSYTKNYQ